MVLQLHAVECTVTTLTLTDLDSMYAFEQKGRKQVRHSRSLYYLTTNTSALDQCQLELFH